MTFEKFIVEEVPGWLRIFNDGTVDRTWNGPPEVEFLIKPVPPSTEFIHGVSVRDLVIDNKNRGLRVRVYIPQLKHTDTIIKFPVLLHFHGGGFCVSQADWYMYHQFYARLVESARVICVSVYLSHAPEHRLPKAFHDAFDALLWLRSLAQSQAAFSDDPTESWLINHSDFCRVFLIGDSSGGNLVHLVAARAGEEDLMPLRLVGAILLNPGFVRAQRSKSEMELQFESPMLTLEMIDKFLSLALPKGSTKDHPFSCPMGPEAPPLSELKLPPFLVMIAENDLIKDPETEYCEKMKDANKDIEVVTNSGVGHCFYLNKIAVDHDPNTADQTKNLLLAIIDFIRKH